MAAIVWVGLGGCLGSLVRYALSNLHVQGSFPLTTFLINLVGSFLMGVVFELASTTTVLDKNMVLFLQTGFCGGFTTFSTFSLETLTLFDEGRFGLGASYAVGSVVVCVVGVVLGRLLVRTLRTSQA